MENQQYPDISLQDDIRNYLAVLRRWFWLWAAIGLVMGSAVFCISLLQPRVYKATAILTLWSAEANLSLEPKYQTTVQNPRYVINESTLSSIESTATNGTILASILSQISSSLEADQRTIAGLRSQLDVGTNNNSVFLVVADESSERAALIANARAEILAQKINETYSEQPVSLQTIKSQATDAKYIYDQAEADYIGGVQK